MHAWTEQEAGRFLASVADDRLFPLWRLALATGMRRGELWGLRWRDVDLEARSITVASTRVVADRVEIGEPKTKAGHRIISIDAGTVSVLSTWRKAQAEERLLVGAGWRDYGVVFVDSVGEPPHPETVTVGFRVTGSDRQCPCESDIPRPLASYRVLRQALREHRHGHSPW